MEVRPRSWFSSTYDVLDAGRVVATFDFRALREAGDLEVDGRPYAVRRAGVRGEWLLREAVPSTTEVARARKPSAWHSQFEVRWNDRTLDLRRRGFWSTRSEVREHGALVGTITRTGAFSRALAVELRGDVPLPVQVLLLWLAVLLDRRDTAAAGAAAAGAAASS